ncbi:unnamed protein product [Anisakis simplex]|uniref:Secreted protein n=1 Tax=Anisakis simplex TaxID=6269 RepID=A0A0M3JX03_ANISI|nr:unnamed protein product [Anisakis simplex]
MSWPRERIDTFLIIFTIVVASIALLLVLFVFLKDKICPRRSIYAPQPTLANDTAAAVATVRKISPMKQQPLRSEESECMVDVSDLDYIDERSIHLISSTVVVDSLHNNSTNPKPVAL